MGWGRRKTEEIEKYDHLAGVWFVGDDLPQERNAVTLDPQVKDQFAVSNDGDPTSNDHTPSSSSLTLETV